MQLITWLLRLIIFVGLVCFSMINSENITLNYYHDRSLELPLSVVLLFFFGLGVVLTLITAPSKTAAKK
ncbi:LapA family protein [Nitrosomonas sp.]|uniref:LapA family protein n=1 Tax=Nitrosomonas sp. TaxID=42353 RepID=UPI0025CBD93C|nr:LapA family protein [Nitrosomonas sp.]MDR4514870.1 LapA family protein [Nitrosomonas sp.]